MDIYERGDKAYKVLEEHGDTFVDYNVTTEDGSVRTFKFTISEIILMEYGAYSPFEPDMLAQIFKDMKNDTNFEGFEKMEEEINRAVANGRWV